MSKYIKKDNILLSEFHDWIMLSLNYLIYFIQPDWLFGYIEFREYVIRAGVFCTAYPLLMGIYYFIYNRCIEKGDIRIILLAGTAPATTLLLIRKYFQTNIYPLLPVLFGTCYLILILGRYCQLKRKVSKRKARYMWKKMKMRMACCIYLMLLVTGLGVLPNRVSSLELLPSVINAEAGEIWDSNQEYLAYWKEAKFKNLSQQERLELCEKLVQMECMYYEMEPLHIIIEEYPQPNRLGYYSPSDRLISISPAVIEGSRYMLLETLLHEFHHYYAHTLVETKGFISNEAVLYKQGFETYHSDCQNWNDYYSNPVEVAARGYAAEWTTLYLTYIDSISV